MVNNYFKVPEALDVDGIFPFVDGDTDSTRLAFELATLKERGCREKAAKNDPSRICVWRKTKGSWARVPVIGEARPGAVWL